MEKIVRTEEGIKRFLNKEIVKFNKTYNENVELINFDIKFNGRLSRTLGRYRFYNTRNGIVPHSIEISKKIVNNAKENTLIEVCKHELSHYIADYIHDEDCGHDARWKCIAKKLGVPDTTTANIGTLELGYRYMIICKNDGVIGGRDRLDDSLKFNFRNGWVSCRRCGSHDVYIYDAKEKKILFDKEFNLEENGLECLKDIVR